MKRLWILMMISAALALAMAGCSDDEPTGPNIPPNPPPVAVSPDSLMSLVRTAVETRDLDLYDSQLDPDFSMAVSPWEGNFGELPTDHMTRGEAITAAANMFGGQAVTNWQGEPVPGVTAITIYQWERLTEWVAPAAKDGPEDMPPAPVVSSIWALRMFIERGTGYPLLAAAGTYNVNAWWTMVDEQAVYSLSSMQILEETRSEEAKSETFGWVGTNLLYLTNEAPTAEIAVTETPGDIWPEYTFDPSASLDEDSGLAPLPYRWRIGEEPFVGPGDWSEWTDQPLVVTFDSTEEQMVTLEVRDRWGATDQAVRTVTPDLSPLPFPDTPDQLMANFKSTYEGMVYDYHRDLIHPDFQMFLQQSTIDQFPDLGETIDLNEELRIHERMLSGDDLTDPNGAFIPGVKYISIGVFNPVADWQVSPPDDPIPDTLFAPYDVDFLFSRGPSYSYLRVQGQVRFYVTSRDSLYQGAVHPYYQMVGQVDFTGGMKGVESVNFGDVKALFR